MKLKLNVVSVKLSLPTSNWSKYTTRYSKNCLVWNGLDKPSLAFYDRQRNMWFTDEQINPEPTEWIDDVYYWAEIPNFDELTFY